MFISRVYRYSVLLLLGVATLTSGCRSRRTLYVPPPNAAQVYTLTNLHPDEVRGRLYSVNYQQAGMIYRCTPVRIERVTSRDMVFYVQTTGRRYEYIFHRSLRDSVQAHLDLYFGTQCDPNLVATLGPADQAGIRDGRIYPGMTRQGVVLAAGYPPSHATASLDMSVWRYWRSRMTTFDVQFAGGVVVGLRE